MNKTKLLIALVAALLALNTATLVFIWLQRPPRTLMDGRQGRDAGEVLSQQLGFTQQQQQQFNALRKGHHGQMVAYGDSLIKLKDSLFVLLINRDSVRAGEIIQGIGGVHQNIEQITFDHFQQVRQVCSPEQRQKYDLMIKNAYQEVQRPSRGQAMNDRGQPGRAEGDSLGQRGMPPGAESGRPGPGQGPAGNRPNEQRPEGPPPGGKR